MVKNTVHTRKRPWLGSSAQASARHRYNTVTAYTHGGGASSGTQEATGGVNGHKSMNNPV